MPVVKTLKAFFAPKDMTEGAPWKRIAEFMIPMLIGNVAQQLYNTADSIIVGRYIGDNALAAVGSAGPILHLLLVFFMGISMGAASWSPSISGLRTGRTFPVPSGTVSPRPPLLQCSS